AEIEDLVRVELEVDLRHLVAGGAAERQPGYEQPGARDLVARLREAVSDVLERPRHERFRIRRRPGDREVVRPDGRELRLRHRGEAVAVLDTAEDRTRAGSNHGRVELCLDIAACERKIEIVHRLGAELELDAGRVRLGNVERDARGAGTG